jgi:hypothetical protein
MNNKTRAALAAGLALLAALSLAGCVDRTEAGCLVTDKDRVAGYKGSSDSRVYTSCGVFSVHDEIVKGQWNSADTYGAIEVGKTYTFETYGERNGFFSLFPNIITVTEVK